MKKTFFKTIALILILGALSIVSGSCTGAWLENKTGISIAPKVASANNTDLIASETCGNYDMGLKLDDEPVKHSNNLMPCCESDNDPANTLSPNKKFDFSDLLPVDLTYHDERIFVVTNKTSLPSLPLLSPPEQASISATNIRI